MARGRCTPEQMAECPLMQHFTDVHHLYHPRADYRSPIEKQYRELPHHKVQICRNEHNEIHATEKPPTKPDRAEMVRAIASYMMKEVDYGQGEVHRG